MPPGVFQEFRNEFYKDMNKDVPARTRGVLEFWLTQAGVKGHLS